MSDSRTLSARKTLYLDAPIVSVVTPNGSGFEVGGLSLGQWSKEFDVSYGNAFAASPITAGAIFRRNGGIIVLSLPPMAASAVGLAGEDIISITPTVAGVPLVFPDWALPTQGEIYFPTKILVNALPVDASIKILGGGSPLILIYLTTPLTGGEAVQVLNCTATYLGGVV